MTERQMEIIISRGIEEVLGEGHKLIAQQVSVGSAGRLDLLVSKPDGTRMVIELKKGRLTDKHINQVLRYSETLSEDGGIEIDSMLIGNEASEEFHQQATERGVRIRALTEEKLREIQSSIGLGLAELQGERRKSGVLYGGGGVQARVPVQDALYECPAPIGTLVQELEKEYPVIQFAAGSMQIAIVYKGVKVGGLNRQHRGGHTYISTGVVLTDEHENMLKANQFLKMSKSQKSHEHIGWEIRWIGNTYAERSFSTFRYFFVEIDQILMGSTNELEGSN